MLNLNDLQFFVHVVDCGGFTAAARRLGSPKSTLSKRVAALEAQLGVQLLYRTSRSLTLTDVGRGFMEHARAALIEAEAAEAVVQQRLAEPSGTVRLTAAVPVAQFYLANHLPDLARAYPALQLRVHASDRFVDLVQEGYDIAVRSHMGPLPDSGLVQRQAAVEAMWLVAAPAYLAARGVPGRPHALREHDGLLVANPQPPWQLRHDAGETALALPRTRLVADETIVLLRAAEAGLGIARLPSEVCRAALATGTLARVLPQWTAGSVATTLLMPERRSRLPGVRAVVDFLLQKLGPDTSPSLAPAGGPAPAAHR
jgi:DNA-binding transcriptional LysR family regulator